MLEITEKQLLSYSDLEKIEILKMIVLGQAKYKGSE